MNDVDVPPSKTPLPGLVPVLPKQQAAARRSFDAVSVCFGIMIGVMIGSLGTMALMPGGAPQTISRAAEQLDGFFQWMIHAQRHLLGIIFRAGSKIAILWSQHRIASYYAQCLSEQQELVKSEY